MLPLELNLEKIALIGEQKEDENMDFRIFLKGQDVEYVDEIVHRLHDQITAEIDCQQCGNCCNSLRPYVSEADIEYLAGMDNLTPDEFRKRFVTTGEFDDEEYLKDMPCKYLKGKSCSIYSRRPEDCRSYPHTRKPEFITRTYFMIEHYSICPIVFNLMEQLKEELDFDDSSDMMFF